MGSFELLDDYDELWATIIDESANSVTSDSMLTAQEGWSSDMEERDQSIMEQQRDEAQSAKARDVHQVNTQLMDEIHQVLGMYESQVLGIQIVTRWGNLTKGGMLGKVMHDGGSQIINWFNFKLNQCMFDTWINGDKKWGIKSPRYVGFDRVKVYDGKAI